MTAKGTRQATLIPSRDANFFCAKTLHRNEEKVLRREVDAAGFRLAATASFLRNPDDKRDWNASDDGPKELRGTSDRFVHRYLKIPEALRPGVVSVSLGPGTLAREGRAFAPRKDPA